MRPSICLSSDFEDEKSFFKRSRKNVKREEKERMIYRGMRWEVLILIVLQQKGSTCLIDYPSHLTLAHKYSKAIIIMEGSFTQDRKCFIESPMQLTTAHAHIVTYTCICIRYSSREKEER